MRLRRGCDSTNCKVFNVFVQSAILSEDLVHHINLGLSQDTA